jgi:hypothetical protein
MSAPRQADIQNRHIDHFERGYFGFCETPEDGLRPAHAVPLRPSLIEAICAG